LRIDKPIIITSTNDNRASGTGAKGNKMKNYIVIIRFKFPAWDEKCGLRYEVKAKNKSDAIKQVRKLSENYGHVGVRYYKAEEN